MTSVARVNGRAAQAVLSIAGSIPVRIIGEPLLSYDAKTRYADAVDAMEQSHFDVAGVADGEGRVVGYIDARAESDGTCGDTDHLHAIEPGMLVTDSMPLTEALPIVARTRRVFVLNGDRTTMIVTRADLQKAPVRMMIFGTITVMEIHLTDLLRREWAEDKWCTCGPFTPKQVRAIKHSFDKAKNEHEETDVFDVMNLDHKSALAQSIDSLIVALNMSGSDDLEARLTEIRKLRNDVAHGKTLATPNRTWNRVVRIMAETQRVSNVLERLLPDCDQGCQVAEDAASARRESLS
jgi:hypothetical protein